MELVVIAGLAILLGAGAGWLVSARWPSEVKYQKGITAPSRRFRSATEPGKPPLDAVMASSCLHEGIQPRVR
ncbi:hypothetical protein ACFWGA_14720, partial [Amycolatopsis lurida]